MRCSLHRWKDRIAIDLTQLFDDSKSLAEGAITIPGYKVDGWWTVRI